MNRIWKAGIAAVLGLCAVGGAAWADQQLPPEAEAIKEAFIGAEETSAQIGYFVSDTGKTDTLTEEQLQAYIDAFNANMDRYYSSDNGCREQYKELNEQYLREVAKDEVYYLVDSGTIDCALNSVNISADGQTATAHVVYTSWGNEIEENENGELEVNALIGQNAVDVTMVKEDGQWKFQGYDEILFSTGVDVIEDLQESGKLTNEQQAVFEQYMDVNHAVYSSFADAYQAAQRLQADAINPYPLAEKLGISVEWGTGP